MTAKLHNPTDIARETLKQLAARRIAPTPDRYEEIYAEIAGTPRNSGGIAALVTEFVALLRACPQQHGELQRQIGLIEKAALSREWSSIPPLVVQAVEGQGGQANLVKSWSELIRDLITQWDLRSPHFSVARKQESLAKVLLNFGNYPNLLNEKLAALIQSWADGASAGGDIAPLETAAGVAGNETTTALPIAEEAASASAAVDMDWRRWRELLVKALRMGVAERLSGYPELAEEASSLALAAEAVTSAQGLEFLQGRLKKFWIQLELRGERDGRVATALSNLLLLLCENLLTICGPDDWIKGQVAVIRELLSQPLSTNRLYDVEAAFKEVIYKQASLKHSLDEAQTMLKDMVTLFIDRLGDMADSTSGYSEKIETYAGRIEQTKGISELQGLLSELMQDTRVMQLDMTRSRDELVEARAKAEQAGVRVSELERQLRLVSEKIREDQLTGALNRRGFKESFETELARKERSGKPLCVALLDIDNFKKLNDQRGHQAGDEALVHLVDVVKVVLRPTDVIARYGGEEFVVLLPETDLKEAASVMRRVQRELTRRFFLHNNERVLITFSAGVTRYIDGES
ncbi:GGDEF domain-containing protein, partial [Chitinimonas sp.]|uniref:GGDEF domain-containing protein n=1 Tax=Chitinimonas sp. TaxID=1934313 RepID=UPI0035AE69A3